MAPRETATPSWRFFPSWGCSPSSERPGDPHGYEQYGHPEPATQRFAVREIGRVKAAPAVYQLTRALEDLNVLRSHELKKEIIRALEHIGTAEAERALRRTADRKLVLGRKSRELRRQARAALSSIRNGSTAEGADTP